MERRSTALFFAEVEMDSAPLANGENSGATDKFSHGAGLFCAAIKH